MGIVNRVTTHSIYYVYPGSRPAYFSCYSDRGGDVRRLWAGVTVVRKCAISKRGVASIRKVCQLVERCDGHGGM